MTDLYAPAQPNGPAPSPRAGGLPVRPKRQWTRERIAALSTAVFVLGGGLIGLLASGGSSAESARGAVEAFLEARQDGDYATAYGLLCADYRRGYNSVRDYAEQADGSSRFSEGSSAQVTDVAYAHQNGQTGFAVTAVLGQYGERQTVDFFVVEENQAFRVCGYSSAD